MTASRENRWRWLLQQMMSARPASIPLGALIGRGVMDSLGSPASLKLDLQTMAGAGLVKIEGVRGHRTVQLARRGFAWLNANGDMKEAAR